jgi:hypothetical protein
MAQQFQVSLALAAASANAIALTQTPAGAGNLTVVGGVATLDTARRVLFTPSGSEATNGTIWTVYGTNRTGNLISEVVNGTNSPATASTLNDFVTVTRISVNKAQAGAIVVGTSGVASSPWFIVDRHITPINLSVIVITTGVINFSVEYTYDNPNEPFTGAAPAIFTQPAMASKTTSTDAGNIFNFPVFALRLTQNSFTAPATAKMIVAQAGLVSGSIYQPVAVLAGTPPSGTYDAATTAWINAVVAAGGTVSAGRKAVVDTLITGLKTDGIWAKLDRLWIFAAENSQSALVDLVAQKPANPITSPPFTVDRGYTCNGTAGVGSGFNPSTDGVNFTLNTAHTSLWSLTSGQSTQYTALSGQTNMFTRYSDDNLYVRINNNAGGIGANADGSGFFLGVRTAASGAGCIMGYRNGSVLVNDATGTAALDAAPWIVNDRQIASASVGGPMTGTDSTKFYNRMRTYMTAVGVP